jgi:general secretion pathway protein A
VICDTALVYGYADGQKTIDKSIIENVIKERDESGIFSGLDIGSPKSAKNGLPEEKGFDTSNTQLQMMEKRIDSLEATIGGFQGKIQNLNNLKNKRDDIIIELLKMLEQSMKSRMKLLSLVSPRKNINNSGSSKEHETKSQKISLAKK